MIQQNGSMLNKTFLTFIFFIFMCSSGMANSPELADSHWAAGEELERQGKFLEAAQKYAQAVAAEEASESPRLQDLTMAYFKIGYCNSLIEKHKESLKAYKKALELARTLSKDPSLVMLMERTSEAHSSLGEFKESIRLYHEAIALNEALNREEENIRLLNLAGKMEYASGQYLDALSSFNVAVELSAKLGKKNKLADQLNNLASIEKKLGLHTEALNHFRQVLDLDRKAGKQAEMSNDLSSIGLVLSAMNQLNESLKHHKEALVIAEKLNWEKGMARDHNNIAAVHSLRGEYKQALEHHKRCFQLNLKLDRPDKISRDLGNLGSDYSALGQFDRALELHTQALEIAMELGDDRAISGHLNNIGLIHYEQSRYPMAISHFKRALKIDRQINTPEDVSRDLNNIGTVHEEWGQLDKALEKYMESLEIDRQIGDIARIADGLNNIAGIHLLRGNLTKALRAYSEALEIDRKLGHLKEIATNLNNIGVVHNSMKNSEEAISAFEEALEISRRLGLDSSTAASLGNLGNVHHGQGKLNKALRMYTESAKTNRRQGQSAALATDLHNIGTVHQSGSQHKKASKYFSESLEIIENLRNEAKGTVRRDYLSSQLSTYEQLSFSLMKSGDHEALFQNIEQSKARLLAERLSIRNTNIKIPDLKTVQAELDADEAVLIYANTGLKRFILMVLTQAQTHAIELNPEDLNLKAETPLTHAVSAYRAQLGVESFKEKTQRGMGLDSSQDQRDVGTENLGQRLHSLLIEKAIKRIGDKNRLTIVPDGVLAFLPFDSLKDANGTHLVERFEMRSVQSMTIHHLLSKRVYDKNRKSMLAFGGAVYGEEDAKTPLNRGLLESIQAGVSLRGHYSGLGYSKWSPLPGSLLEVKNIARFVNGTTVIQGQDVSESKIKSLSVSGKLAQYRMIHFATHGLVVPSTPELSAIVLSWEKESASEDGYLRMGEIAKLKLKADFVNLSACETGLGKIYGGEGVVGLSQAFLIAGANALSVSLWQVDDSSTAAFMTEFYKKTSRGISFSNALNKTKREFLRGEHGAEWRKARHWAPFVYYGK